MMGNRIALVTGASRGIGRAVALELASRGCRLALNYQSSGDAAESLADEIRGMGGDAFVCKANIADPAEVKALFAETEKNLGPVEILVNNAGITRDNLVLRMKDEEWNAIISTNLNSVFYCTREAVRGMAKARFGRIVAISSVSGLVGNAGQANYSAAKAGVNGFVKSVAREFASRGITVNSVAPGYIQTDMTEALPENVRESIMARIPLARYGKPEDVASAVGFLTSDEASYITGQVLAVDGGMTM